MMGDIHKKIEAAANIAIIGAVLLLGAVVAQRFWNKPEANSQPAVVKAGEQFSLPGYNWGGSEKNLVLVLQKGCRFCTESAPFYQRLVQTAQAKNVQLVAIFPHDVKAGEQYLKEQGVPVNEMRQAVLSDLKIQATPTLLLINKEGVVTEAWVGKLPTEKEEEVLSRLQ